ncbi:hypothetical protein GCM10007908_03540 [Rhizobium albus]|nr:hypothetical protein GCM10007908_03540 [Rhizobium albus]
MWTWRDMLILHLGRWWEVGFSLPFLSVSVGWDFVRYQLGLKLRWGQAKPEFGMMPYRRNVFIPLARSPLSKLRRPDAPMNPMSYRPRTKACRPDGPPPAPRKI